MLKTKNLIFIFCVFLSAIVFGQERDILGKITNEKDVEGIHILNRTSKINTITDRNGSFSIYAVINDTLFISSLHYMPEKLVVTKTIYEDRIIAIKLRELVNELKEVFIGHSLTGNLSLDAQNIDIKKQINFDDVGIPGFKGVPMEKIAPTFAGVGLLNTVDIEAMYKHLSGYYKTLRTQRKWEAENNVVAKIIDFYTIDFFEEAYAVPESRLYDFLLFCVETTSLEIDFKRDEFGRVLEIFRMKSKDYVKRLSEKKE